MRVHQTGSMRAHDRTRLLSLFAAEYARIVDLVSVVGLPSGPPPHSRESRQVAVALWLACPRKLRPLQRELAAFLGVSPDTVQRDKQCTTVRRRSDAIACALWGGLIVASVRAGLLAAAKRATAGDLEALAAITATADRLGLTGDVLLGGAAAGAGGIVLPDGGGVSPLLAGDDAAELLADAFAAIGGAGATDAAGVGESDSGGAGGAPPARGAAAAR